MTVAPSATTFSKTDGESDNADVVVTVTTNSASTVSTLTLDGADVPKSNATNWSVSGGLVVTLKKAYLSTLDNGANAFTVTMSDSETVEFTITVS